MRLKTADAPITITHCRVRNLACPRPKSATSTAADWPKTASQRSRISVRSRTQPLRASVASKGRLGSVIAAA